jgi:hypothetical protein
MLGSRNRAGGAEAESRPADQHAQPGEARSEMNQTSTASPYTAVAMTLALLSHPAAGPNGRFYARDGRHLEFAYAKP